MSAIKIDFEHKKHLKQIDIEMPHETVVLQYDALDGNILARLTEIYEDFKILENKAETAEQAAQTVEAVKRLSNCIDYIFNTNISKELFKEVAPMTIIVADEKQTPLVFHILKSLEPALKVGIQDAKKEQAKEFLNRHA